MSVPKRGEILSLLASAQLEPVGLSVPLPAETTPQVLVSAIHRAKATLPPASPLRNLRTLARPNAVWIIQPQYMKGKKLARPKD